MRIYALAKELKVDSKELANICAKAGITGKGSALASLDDGEVEKLKTFLSGPTKKAPAPAPAPVAVPVAVATPTSPPKERAPKPAAPEPAEPRKYTRDDYIAPVGSGKVKVLAATGASSVSSSSEAKTSDESAAPKPKKKKEPVISLAKLPEVKQPTSKPKPSEPPAQKPEIRLPKDAITGPKKGRAPLEHLTKAHEKSKTSRGGEKPSTGGKGDRSGAGPAPLGKPGKGHRAKPGDDESNERSLAGMASARADRQKARRTRAKSRGRGDDDHGRRRRRTLTRKGTNTAAPRKGSVALELPCTVRSFSEAAGIPSAQVQKALIGLGLMVTINAQIDEEYVDLLTTELDVELEFKARENLEDSLLTQIRDQEDTAESLSSRPPVITFLGHVDHGKTSLLDKILGSDVVSGEAGGITQHIRAYRINNEGRDIAFVDTPGHEAFTEMRARGAHVTDIAVLVVAADDGVMPQTEEAISHAKAAGVPIVVALNKMDLPGADVTQALQQLAAKELLPSEWGGDVEVVKTSATTGDGIDELIDTLLTLAELHEYKANPSRSALGTCLEAEQEPGRGVVAKLIVQNGTMKPGDIIVCGPAHGRIKAMFDTLRTDQRLDAADPSTPVNVTGLDIAPMAGDSFYVLDEITQAREIAAQRATRSHQMGLSGQTTRISFDKFQQLLADGRLGESHDVSVLNLIIRADTQGSIEAITKEMQKLDHPEVQIKILQQSVGGITIGDVHLADASRAVIVGFNVIPDGAARALADERQIEIRRYDVIYKVTDDVKATLEGKLKPEEHIVELGRAVVKQVFPISRVGAVAGCYVAQGMIQRGCRIRVHRDGRTIGEYPLESLRRDKDDTKEVPRGMECGMKLVGFNDIKQDDILEAYKIEEVARTL